MSKLVVANWKQNKNLNEVHSWIAKFESLISGFDLKDVQMVICPPTPYLVEVAKFTSSYDNAFTGVQDVSQHMEGQHTGEVSAKQDADFARYCIVGHSERAEPRDIVLDKAKNCHTVSMLPIVCFVEPEELLDFEGVDGYYLWEDPATISRDGEFVPKSSEDIALGIANIKKEYNTGLGLLYGGSINKNNIVEIAKITDLDGVVSGSASLDPDHFFEIVSAFVQ